MQRRLSIVLLCAVMIAGAASYVVYRLSGGGQKAVKPAVATQVVVAARDLEIGTLVHESDLTLADWVGVAPKGATLKKSLALNRGVVSAIYRGEPVTENRLAPSGSGGGLAATIPAGMRACAIKVNEVVGVAGFVIPGMRVDVLITGSPIGEAAGEGPRVKTLLQSIQVLSAGANIEPDKEGKPQQVQVVNLLVTPHQAEILSLAAGNDTRIQLVLRNPMDTEVTAPPGTSMSELFGGSLFGGSRQGPALAPRPPEPVAQAPVAAFPPPVIAPAPSGFETIEVLNGPTHTVARFPSSSGIRSSSSVPSSSGSGERQ
jgi:pilus assembly protein CpaB